MSSITSRSIPTPTPPVGGMPCSSASRNSSSWGWVSSSPASASRALGLEALALLVGVGQLGERVGDLHAPGKRLPALGETLLGAMRARERRQLDRVVEHERGLDQLRLHELGEQVVGELRPGEPLGGHAQVALGDGRHELGGLAQHTQVDAGGLAHRVGEAHSPPRRPEVQLALVADRGGRARHHRLQACGLVAVVGVGLIPLDHRELGVVLGGEALVAEVLAELVHALQTTHDQALEVQLGGDPQVQLAIQGVVVGRERTCHGAAVERLQARASRPPGSPLPSRYARTAETMRARSANSLRASSFAIRSSSRRRWRVSTSIKAGMLVGRRAQGLAEDLKAVHAQGELAVARAQRRAVDAEQVAEVEREQLLERVRAEHVRARVQLDLAAAVDQVEERGLAGAAAGGDAPGDAMGVLGLLADLQVLVGGAHVSDRLDPGKA